ncbi:MAG: IspD/TarI family cytidylyltransferase [Lachnospiraceae bacterium]|nr:IspD/TarI family cytidylyltransferase [Lachnospiraceae bacterium]
MSKNIAIIFAGGVGTGVGSAIPKQFIEVNHKAVIIYTLEIFENHPDIDAIYVSCKEEYIEKLQEMSERYHIHKIRKIVPGGATGMDSIYNALCAASKENEEDAVVLIHDGVRPCITKELIDRNLAAVRHFGSAITAVPLYETPVISEDGQTVDQIPTRSKCYIAQAPQCFTLGEVIKAHEKMRTENPGYKGIVDTCSMMRMLGKELHLVAGSRKNIKITTPEDLHMFHVMIQCKGLEDE